VRDWILLRYGQFTWPNFNIADSLLVVGTGMLLWSGFRERETTNSPAS
jgi:signal peptidase II